MSDRPPLVCCSGNCRHGAHHGRASGMLSQPESQPYARMHLQHMDKTAMRMSNGRELVECSIMGRLATPGPERRQLLGRKDVIRVALLNPLLHGEEVQWSVAVGRLVEVPGGAASEVLFHD